MYAFRLARLILVSAGVACAAAAAGAAQVNWDVPAGLYTNGSSWAGGSVPAPADQASVQNGGVCTVDGGTTQTVAELWAGNGSGTTGAVEQTGGLLDVTNGLSVARDGSSVGAYTLSGGTLRKTGLGATVIGDAGGGSGAFTLSSAGAYVHTNGNFLVGGTGAGAGTGTLNIEGGTFALTSPGTANNFMLGNFSGASGEVHQSGGVVDLGRELWVSHAAGARGVYNLSGGLLRVANWIVVGRNGGNDGLFNLTGGVVSNTLNNVTLGSFAGDRGRLVVDGTGRLNTTGNLWVGEGGQGALVVSNGTVYAAGALSVGQAATGRGSWLMAGGDVSANTFYVGALGNAQGVVTQLNGVVTVRAGENRIGGYGVADINATGAYFMRGGTLSSAGAFQVGAYGKGSFEQAGGLVSVGPWPCFGRFITGVGQGLISGGIFRQTGTTTGIIVGEAGAGTLTVTNAGVVDAAGWLIVGHAPTGRGTLDLEAGGAVTVTNAAGVVNSIVVGNNQGGAGSVGTFNQRGGSLTVGKAFVVGNGSTGTYNLSGGTATLQGQVRIGEVNASGRGFVNITGGTLVKSANAVFGLGFLGSTGTVTQTGGSVQINAGYVSIGANGAGRGTYNLLGGTFTMADYDCNIADVGTSRGLFHVGGTGEGTVRRFLVGKVSNTAGVYRQTGGKFHVLAGTGDAIVGGMAGQAAGYGAVLMQGGEFELAHQCQIGVYGTGVYEQSGGTFSATVGYPVLGRYAGGHGTALVSGGAFAHTQPATLLIVGEAGTGILTVASNGVVTTVNALRLAHVASGVGIVNLNGGRIEAPGVSENGGTSAFNFAGGLLKATLPSLTFMQGLDRASVWSGGARIDTAGFNVTLAQPLLAPVGLGVAAIPVLAGGSGYLAPPAVQIAGDGSGATAFARVDTNGAVTAVEVTCPGINYTGAPTVTLVGGGGTGATLGEAVLAPQASGGLVKLGGGTLELGGVNTYTGNTEVVEGTLQLNNACLSPGSRVTLAPAAFLSLSFSGTNQLKRLFIGAGELSAGLYRPGSLPQVVGPGNLLVTGVRPPGTVLIVQ